MFTHTYRLKVILLPLKILFLVSKTFAINIYSVIESGKVIFKANQFFTPNPWMQRVCQWAGILPKLQLHSGPSRERWKLHSYYSKARGKNRRCASESYRNTTSKLNKAIHLESSLKISKAGRSKFIKNEQIDQIGHVIISSSFASVEIAFFPQNVNPLVILPNK